MIEKIPTALEVAEQFVRIGAERDRALQKLVEAVASRDAAWKRDEYARGLNRDLEIDRDKWKHYAERELELTNNLRRVIRSVVGDVECTDSLIPTDAWASTVLNDLKIHLESERDTAIARTEILEQSMNRWRNESEAQRSVVEAMRVALTRAEENNRALVERTARAQREVCALSFGVAQPWSGMYQRGEKHSEAATRIIHETPLVTLASLPGADSPYPFIWRLAQIGIDADYLDESLQETLASEITSWDAELAIDSGYCDQCGSMHTECRCVAPAGKEMRQPFCKHCGRGYFAHVRGWCPDTDAPDPSSRFEPAEPAAKEKCRWCGKSRDEHLWPSGRCTQALSVVFDPAPAKPEWPLCMHCGFGAASIGHTNGDHKFEPCSRPSAEPELRSRSGCPCRYTTPCDPRCTCVMKWSSSGCARCCSYGSAEQRRSAAQHLAGLHARIASDAATIAELTEARAAAVENNREWERRWQAADATIAGLRKREDPETAWFRCASFFMSEAGERWLVEHQCNHLMPVYQTPPKKSPNE